MASEFNCQQARDIVKGLVEGMGGEIRLYSNEECGFCVKVYLPLEEKITTV